MITRKRRPSFTKSGNDTDKSINLEDYGISSVQPEWIPQKNSKPFKIGDIIGKWLVLLAPVQKGPYWGAICECQCQRKTRKFKSFSDLNMGRGLSCKCIMGKGTDLCDGIKKCAKCLIDKTEKDFYKNKALFDGLDYICKQCTKNEQLKTQYKIDYKIYEDMLIAQDYKCKICNKITLSRKLDVDHCHATGKVRGLLCNHCNMGLGYFLESIDALTNAICYLKENN